MAENMEFILSIDDKGTPTLKSFEDQVKKTSTTTQNESAKMSDGWLKQAVSIAIVEEALRKSIAAWMEQSKANALLEATIKGNTSAWEDYANKLMAATNVGDEQILTQVALLKAMGMTDDQASLLTETAAKMANVYGTDLKSNIDMLLQSLNGQVRHLAILDPKVKTLTESQLASGEAIKIMSAKLGEMNQTIQESDYGLIKQKTVAVGEAFESAGSQVLKLAKALHLVGGDENSGVFVNIIQSLGRIVGDFAGLVNITTGGLKEFWGWATGNEALKSEGKSQIEKAKEDIKALYDLVEKKQEKQKPIEVKTDTLYQGTAGIKEQQAKIKALTEDWKKYKLELQGREHTAGLDEDMQAIDKLRNKYQEDAAKYKELKLDKSQLDRTFQAEELKLIEELEKKIDARNQADLMMGFDLQKQKAEMLDDEKEKIIALAVIEKKKNEADLKYKLSIGEISTENFSMAMKQSDELYNKTIQSQQWLTKMLEDNKGKLVDSIAGFFDYADKRAFDFGRMFQNILHDIYMDMIKMQIVKPLVNAGVSAIPTLFSAQGNVFGGNTLSDYRNSIVSQPTIFPFAKGGAPNVGVMGEAGSEAIVPLKRTASGNLGVEATNTAQNMKIEIINQSGQKLQVTNAQSTQNNGLALMQIWLSEFDRNTLGVRDKFSR